MIPSIDIFIGRYIIRALPCTFIDAPNLLQLVLTSKMLLQESLFNRCGHSLDLFLFHQSPLLLPTHLSELLLASLRLQPSFCSPLNCRHDCLRIASIHLPTSNNMSDILPKKFIDELYIRRIASSRVLKDWARR